MIQVHTGISGLDAMMNGGIPRSRTLLAKGVPGSGKTILSLHFLVYGATAFNEAGIYVSLGESRNNLLEEMVQFGWELDALERAGMMRVIDASPLRSLPRGGKMEELIVGGRDFSIVSLVERIRRDSSEIDSKRIVVDPVTSLLMNYPNDAERRSAMLQLLEGLAQISSTNILIAELGSTGPRRDVQVEEYLTDGVIILETMRVGNDLVRVIQIEKLRGVSHDFQPRPYRITDSGIQIFATERVL